MMNEGYFLQNGVVYPHSATLPSSSTSTTSLPSTGTLSTNAAGTTITSSSNSNNGTAAAPSTISLGAALGIGLGLGIPILIVLSGILVCLIRRTDWKGKRLSSPGKLSQSGQATELDGQRVEEMDTARKMNRDSNRRVIEMEG